MRKGKEKYNKTLSRRLSSNLFVTNASFFRNHLPKAFLLAACCAFLTGFLANLAHAVPFSQRTRLEMGGGYNFGQHTISHYSSYYASPNTSKLDYTRHRGEGRVALSWSGFWKLDEGRQGLYLRSVPAINVGGSSQGNLNDKDFCDGSQKAEPISVPPGNIWVCPQRLTVWSDTDSPVHNWFLAAEIDNSVGFFLQNPDNQERFFGAGFSFGYTFLQENDIARGLKYNSYLLPDPKNQRPLDVLLYAGQDAIGNKVVWNALKVGVEVWTEQVPPNWREPIILNLAVRYIPYASFLGEDSHFLRVGTTENHFAPVPNIIAMGIGQGTEVEGSIFIPFFFSQSPRLGLILQAHWRRLFVKQGQDRFYAGDGSSSLYPLTEFTTESFSLSSGFSMTW